MSVAPPVFTKDPETGQQLKINYSPTGNTYTPVVGSIGNGFVPPVQPAQSVPSVSPFIQTPSYNAPSKPKGGNNPPMFVNPYRPAGNSMTPAPAPSPGGFGNAGKYTPVRPPFQSKPPIHTTPYGPTSSPFISKVINGRQPQETPTLKPVQSQPAPPASNPGVAPLRPQLPSVSPAANPPSPAPTPGASPAPQGGDKTPKNNFDPGQGGGGPFSYVELPDGNIVLRATDPDTGQSYDFHGPTIEAVAQQNGFETFNDMVASWGQDDANKALFLHLNPVGPARPYEYVRQGDNFFFEFYNPDTGAVQQLEGIELDNAVKSLGYESFDQLVQEYGAAGATAQLASALRPAQFAGAPSGGGNGSVVEWSSQYVGLPYVWGGNGPQDGGFDCSGFTKAAMAYLGIDIPRTAQTQFDAATPISEPQPGDFVFFHYPPNADGSNADYINHVGIYIGNGQMVHTTSAYGGGTMISAVDYANVAGYGTFSQPAPTGAGAGGDATQG